MKILAGPFAATLRARARGIERRYQFVEFMCALGKGALDRIGEVEFPFRRRALA
ncbi:MAG: hypothetical protein WDN50_13870 [Bradyrhizobium sp.]